LEKLTKKTSESFFHPRISAWICLLLMLAGCGVVLQSTESDREQGRKTAQQVKVDMGIYPDTRTTAYLNRLGERLVKVNPDQTFDYKFAIVDQYVPNAFALPGGYIYVSRGILALTNNEDELAGVVGHEIIHVSRRHTARQRAKGRMPTLFALPGVVVGGVINRDLGKLLMAPASIFGGGYLAFHGRQAEFESDQLGQKLAAEAGYDPADLAPILARLEEFLESYGAEKRIPGFFDTHPSTPNRVDRVNSDAKGIDWQPRAGVASSRADFLKNLDGMLVGDDPGMGVFREQDFLHPELDLFLKFPEGWKSINTRHAVFAVAPEKDGMLVVGVAGKGTDPKQAGEQFRKELYKEHRAFPSEKKSAMIGDLPAYLLTYTDDRGKEPLHKHFLWVAYRGLLYQFIAVAPERYRPVLRETAFSFRPLSTKEKDSILETRLRVVEALPGETLQELSVRTSNFWSAYHTSVVNGLEEDQVLKEGQLVKVAISQPYSGGKGQSHDLVGEEK
jgi:predicted Zn-dependent protease